MNISVFDAEFYKDANCNNNNSNVGLTDGDSTDRGAAEKYTEKELMALNSTPSCMTLQRHWLRHKHGTAHVTFDVNALLQGQRCVSGRWLLRNSSVQQLREIWRQCKHC